jgi:ribose 5-phosphate isomerase A
VSAEQEAQKRSAAAAAVAEIENGMVLGLGSGSTVAYVLDALAARIAVGLKVAGVPSSRATAARAQALGIPLTDFTAHRRLDLTIDGADQVERGSLNLVKGLGGALLREKMVAVASTAMIVVADETKLVERLGAKTRVPVELTRFGAELVLDRLAALGSAPVLRMAGGMPFETDNGNYIADCRFSEIADAAALDQQLRAIVGVVVTGLFYGLATKAIIGTETGTSILNRRT